jgi:electron transfer flavoprotein-quinone oxidoreductase
MPDKFDVIIVGAGPSGTACALTLARAGLSVVVFERGEFPGAKNMFGGILYTTVLNRLIPKFWEEAPLERHITRRRFSILSEDAELAFEFRTEAYNRQPPYNHSFTAYRAKFDPWFSKKAEEAGATVIPETVVDDVILNQGKVVGVKARREGGEVYGDVVVSAEGANSFLAKKLELRHDFSPRTMVVAVKEVIGLPREKIQERFCLEGDEGVAMEFFAGAVGGLVGSAFIYTNKETLSVGLGCTVDAYMQHKITPHDIMERFKKHPSIQRYIRGGELLEYSAHMIPEGGYHQVPTLVTDGFLLVGDAAHFVNVSFYHEGTNLAMGSGVLAAETVIEARQKGDYSKKGLEGYVTRLQKSFVLKDLYRYRRLSEWTHNNPQFFKDYPEWMLDLVKDYFTISEDSKGDIWRQMMSKWHSRISVTRTLLELNRFRKVMFGPIFGGRGKSR